MPGRRWIILARAVRGARGHRIPVPIDRVGGQSADGRSRPRLCRGRHAARRLSAAGIVVAFPGRPARAARAGEKRWDLAGPGADGGFRPGAELFRSISPSRWSRASSAGSAPRSSVLVATKMVADWFDSREIVLAMSMLQMSWPFGAMIALPIQAWIGQSFGWPAVMASGAICAVAVLLRVRADSASRRRRRRPHRRRRQAARARRWCR